MRKIIVVSCGLWVVSCIFYANKVLGQTKSPTPPKTTLTSVTSKSDITPSPTPSSDLIEKLKQIEQLKEKIATRVSQLRENEKVAFHGTLSASSSGSFTVKTPDNSEKTVSYLDDTQLLRITAGKKYATTTNKLAVSSTVIVFGYYNEDHSVITAKYIYEITGSPTAITGKIAEINKNDYTVSVTDGKDMKVFDYETATRTNTLNPTQTSFVRSGFSKLKVGDTVRVTGSLDTKQKDRWIADTFYILLSPPLPTVTGEATNSASPTAKLKATSTPSPKPTTSS